MDRPIAIVTGGKGDLGSAVASVLGDSGYEVHAPGRDRLDVTCADSVDAFFASFRSIRLLVHCAGLTRDRPLLRLTEADWDTVLDTNLKGVFLCSRAALRLFPRDTGGHIVTIGSYSAVSPPPGQVNYCAAKAGIIGLTRSLAREVGKRNIRVNAVLPGFLETKMTEPLSPEAKERALRRHSLGRLNTVDDAARFIAFLDTMPAVSGQVFQLDSRV